MKLTGFLLLELSALLFSLRRISAKNSEAEALRSFLSMLEQLHGALGSEAPPMPELLQTLAGRTEGEAAAFLAALSASMEELGARSFRELWSRALRGTNAALDSGAARAIEELGSVLGRYELETQLEAVAACREELRRRELALRQALPQSRRLTLGLSAAAAALLGILLI